jgi:hypothetical protein
MEQWKCKATPLTAENISRIARPINLASAGEISSLIIDGVDEDKKKVTGT